MVASVRIAAVVGGAAAAWAGAPFEKGRSADDLMQPASIIFKVHDLDRDQALLALRNQSLSHLIRRCFNAIRQRRRGAAGLYRNPVERPPSGQRRALPEAARRHGNGADAYPAGDADELADANCGGANGSSAIRSSANSGCGCAGACRRACPGASPTQSNFSRTFAIARQAKAIRDGQGFNAC